MWKLDFTEIALGQLHKLSKKQQVRIIDKIEYFATLQNPCTVAKPMKEYIYGKRRRRIGDYRVIFDIDDIGNIIIILIIGHRSKIYD